MLRRFWNWLPVIVRAIIVGELVVDIGGIVPPLAIIANLRTTPRVPWMILVTGLWLWIFWWYCAEAGGLSKPQNRGVATCAESLYRAERGAGLCWPEALLSRALCRWDSSPFAWPMFRGTHSPRRSTCQTIRWLL